MQALVVAALAALVVGSLPALASKRSKKATRGQDVERRIDRLLKRMTLGRSSTS
jgi:hypothetical protein